MNKKIRVRLDLDEVLNNFADYWLDIHYERTGEELKPTTFDMDNVSKYGEAVYDYFYEPSFFYDIPVKAGATKLLNFLDQNSQYIDYIIVSSVGFTDDKKVREYVREQKHAWLLANFESHVADKLITSGKSKKGYPADIIIDDLDKHIIEAPKKALKILFQAEHNKKVDISQFDERTLVGIKDLKEVEEIIRGVIFEGSIDNYLESR